MVHPCQRVMRLFLELLVILEINWTYFICIHSVEETKLLKIRKMNAYVTSVLEKVHMQRKSQTRHNCEYVENVSKHSMKHKVVREHREKPTRTEHFTEAFQQDFQLNRALKGVKTAQLENQRREKRHLACRLSRNRGSNVGNCTVVENDQVRVARRIFFQGTLLGKMTKHWPGAQ